MTSHLSGDDQSIIVNAMRAAASGGRAVPDDQVSQRSLHRCLGGELTPPSTVGVQSCKGVQPTSTNSGRRSFARRDSELLLKCWSSPTESREISDYRWYGASNGAW